jgi:hypothetical protein
MSERDIHNASEEDIRKWQEEWEKMMITIWREKIRRLHVVDTGQLMGRIDGSMANGAGGTTAIIHKFLQYGIYQDCGTGRGYKHGNGGKLDFLDPLKRKKNIARKQKSGKITLGEPRKPREWFSRAYYASIMVLKEQMAYMYGEAYCGMMTERIEEASNHSGSLRTKLW